MDRRDQVKGFSTALKVLAVAASAVVFFGGITFLYAWSMGSAHEDLFVHDQLVEDPDLVAMIQDHCRTLESDLRAEVDVGGPEVITAENAFVESFVDAVRRDGAQRLRDDPPAEDWLIDWLRLAELRDDYPRELALDPSPPSPKVPTVDDVPIVERMNEAVPGCQVPVEITDDFAD